MNLEAERCVIASMMLAGEDRALYAKIRRQLWRGSFYQEDHRIIFDAITGVFETTGKVDPILVKESLLGRMRLEEIGGVGYLSKILDTVPSPVNGEHYAGIVVDKAKERDAIVACNQILSKIGRPHEQGEIDVMAAELAITMRRLIRVGKASQIVKMDEAVHQFLEDAETRGSDAIDFGFQVVDEDYRGVVSRGGYTLLAGRPSMGKSMMVKDRLMWMARNGRQCGLIAREERQRKIVGNYISAAANVPNNRVASPPWGERDYHAIAIAAGEVAKASIWMNDSARTIDDVIASAEAMVAEHKCEVIAIDHIHLIGTRKSYERKVDQITDVSHALKDLFKTTGVVGIVAAQLSRPAKGIKPAPPEMTDLRDCGGLEEHADAIVFLHREDYYHRNDPSYRSTGECHIGIAKNRNGAVGSHTVKADLECQRFIDMPRGSGGFSGAPDTDPF